MLQNLQENRERKKEQEKKEKERVEIEKLNLQHRITKIDQKEKQLAELKKEKILQLFKNYGLKSYAAFCSK